MKNNQHIKIIILILSVSLLALFGYGTNTQKTNALTTTPTVTLAPKLSPTGGGLDKEQKLIDQINSLKEKVASKVAELKLVEKQGIIGAVEEVEGNKITAVDLNNETRIIDVDELTKFSSPSAKASFGISDITKGTTLGVIGLYNKQSKRILARFVDVITVPQYISGAISDIDKANYTVTVLSDDQNKTIVDIENFTKISSYTDDNDITKSGFSKLTVGDRVYTVGYPNKNEKHRITGTRILVFPDIPNNPKIHLPESAPSEEPSTTPAKATTR